MNGTKVNARNAIKSVNMIGISVNAGFAELPVIMFGKSLKVNHYSTSILLAKYAAKRLIIKYKKGCFFLLKKQPTFFIFFPSRC